MSIDTYTHTTIYTYKLHKPIQYTYTACISNKEEGKIYYS